MLLDPILLDLTGETFDYCLVVRCAQRMLVSTRQETGFILLDTLLGIKRRRNTHLSESIPAKSPCTGIYIHP